MNNFLYSYPEKVEIFSAPSIEISPGSITSSNNSILFFKNLDFSSNYNNIFENDVASKELIPSSPSKKIIHERVSQDGEIERRLFDSLSEIKIFLSQVSMHLDNAMRNKIFDQLDKICNVEEWDIADDPIEISSFRTFIRMIFLINPTRYPGLALANKGNLLAYWVNEDSRLSIECLERDSVKIVLSKRLDNDIDRAAIITTIGNVMNRLSPYSPSCWFDSKNG